MEIRKSINTEDKFIGSHFRGYPQHFPYRQNEKSLNISNLKINGPPVLFQALLCSKGWKDKYDTVPVCQELMVLLKRKGCVNVISAGKNCRSCGNRKNFIRCEKRCLHKEGKTCAMC